MIEETSQFYEDETVSMALAATKLLAEEIINLLINYPIVQIYRPFKLELIYIAEFKFLERILVKTDSRLYGKPS